MFDAFFRADHTIQRPIARRRLCSPIRFVTDPFQDCGPLPVIRHQYIHTTFYNHNLTPKVCMKHINKKMSQIEFQIGISCADNTWPIGRNPIFSSHIGKSQDVMGKLKGKCLNACLGSCDFETHSKVLFRQINAKVS